MNPRVGHWTVEILKVLNDGSCHSPTELGAYIGKRNGCPHWHSSWASSKLKKLEEAGMVEANEQRHYRITAAGSIYLAQLLIGECPNVWLNKTSDGWRWQISVRLNRTDSSDGLEREVRLYGSGTSRKHCLAQIEVAKPQVIKAWQALGGLLPEGYGENDG